VIFVGRVPHAEVAAYYSLVDLFVYPRKSMRLTELVTPLKPLEAMAQGKLVIASDVGGHRELVDPGRTGFLFRAGDAQALAAQLIDTLSRRDEWHAVRQRARSFVERERTWAASVARYEAVYAGLRS
jgi:glycosyltransferase involved in cell wall biosynthesis